MAKGTEDPKILNESKALKRYEELKQKGLIIYECIVGSHSYGLNIETSDVDKFFVYIETLENVLAGKASEQINVTDDYVGYEIGRYMELMGKQNPNILERVHLEERFIEYCHPLFRELVIGNRDSFLSKKVAFSFGSYAKTQIDKAQGTNKKFMNPMDGPRKSLLDFAWVPYKQGSISLGDYLKEKHVPIDWVGLSGIDHMKYTYHLFIDPEYTRIINYTRERFQKERSWWKNVLFIDYTKKEKNSYVDILKKNIDSRTYDMMNPVFRSIYNGPVDVDGVQPKMSSIPKEAVSDTVVHFNLDGFQKYCTDYRDYHEWLTKRNIQRFVENASNEHNYDRKNCLHCHRLLNMCIEILSGQGVKTFRHDREDLLEIRMGNSTFKTVIDSANEKMRRIDELSKTTELPESCNMELIDDIVLQFRRRFYNI